MFHRPTKGQKESMVNSLHKKKIGKEVCMKIKIGDYEVDSVILYLGSDVNILTRQTWKNIGIQQLVWPPIQLLLDNQARVTPIG